MRILHICPDSRTDAPLAPEALSYLGHQVHRIDPSRLPSGRPDSPTAATSTPPSTARSTEPSTETNAEAGADIVVVDATEDLSLAPSIAEALHRADLALPVLVVLGEGGLATAAARWDVTDFILTTAGPAEVEARLRVARDRHRAAAARARAEPAASRARTGPEPGVGGQGDRAETGGAPWATGSEPALVVSGALRIDETSFTATLGTRNLDLTYREFALLKFFAMHPERVFTRDEILDDVWGEDYFGGTRTVDVHVRRLRAKLGKDLENAIHTVRNVGYRFSPETSETTADIDTDTSTGTDPGTDTDTGTGTGTEANTTTEEETRA